MRVTSSVRLLSLVGALALVLGAAYAPAAPAAPASRAVLPDSTWQWPEHSQNLRVLPDTTSAATLRRTMQGFTRALGVRCSACHVGSGPDFATWDFASDAKPHKDVARGMMRMAAELNASVVPAALGEHRHAPATHRHADGSAHVHEAALEHAAEHAPEHAQLFVTCWTCHRGQSHPETAPPAGASDAP